MFCFCFCFFKPVNKSSSQMELKIKYSPISLGKLRIWASVHHSFASMRQLGKKWFVTGGSLLSSLRASSPFGMRSRDSHTRKETRVRGASSLTRGFSHGLLRSLARRLKPRTNGRNIVGQQLPTLLDVACCVRLHILLHVVGCCWAKFETSQTFQPTTPNISFVPWSPKRSATMLNPFAQLFQHCWGRARSLRMVYKDLWVVSFPPCTAGPNIVGSCCVRLHAALSVQTLTGFVKPSYLLLHFLYLKSSVINRFI